MFTGIIEGQSKVLSFENQKLRISNPWSKKDIWMGQSICVDGCCLTVIDHGKNYIDFEVSEETLKKTHFTYLSEGDHINVERAMSFRGSFDGHFVTGHIDNTALVKEINEKEDGHVEVLFEVPSTQSVWIAPKGSVAINGISLTVNDVEKNTFGVNFIPHTWNETNASIFKPKQRVNIEFDVLAKYVDRIVSLRLPPAGNA